MLLHFIFIHIGQSTAERSSIVVVSVAAKLDEYDGFYRIHKFMDFILVLFFVLLQLFIYISFALRIFASERRKIELNGASPMPAFSLKRCNVCKTSFLYLLMLLYLFDLCFFMEYSSIYVLCICDSSM